MELVHTPSHLSLSLLPVTLAHVVEWRSGLVIFIVELYSVV